jgi:hypothetical protein
MTEFKVGDKVRVNEGPLEGKSGFVAEIEENKVRVELDKTEMFAGLVPFYEDSLVPAGEGHDALVHLRRLYPDFLRAPKSDNYRFRLKTYLNGSHYTSGVLTAEMLVRILEKNPPAGLEEVEFMLKKDDPNRGLAWKLLWSES